jgi:MoCo/4Fe-4S cofactor protein with predicted Tat translocation signal
MTAPSSRLDIAELRCRLAGTGGKRYWTSLEEIVDTAAFRDWLEGEFPAAAAALTQSGRREFLKIMGASLLLAGLGGCNESDSDLALPYVNQPEDIVPGVARYYATAVCFEGFAQPVLATCHAGRPTKLDGNPDHPLNSGRSDAFTQAAVLQLYDPDRSQTPHLLGQPIMWTAFARELSAMRQNWAARQGDGLRLLLGDVTSPTLIRQLAQLTAALPKAKLHRFEPVGAAQRQEAMQLAFARQADLHYRLQECDIVISLDDDLLGPGPRQVVHARAWASRRGETDNRLRLYVAESTPTLTGTVATTRLAADASRMSALALALAQRLGVEGVTPPDLSDTEGRWIDNAANDLRDHAGRCLFAAGAHLSPGLQALAATINDKLGNVGNTLWYSEPIVATERGSLADLAHDIESGVVESLVILDTNPIYAAPGELRFADLLPRVSKSLHVGLYRDETAALCRWHLPLAHALESWGDARAIDGTVSIIQPVVAPFYSVRNQHQIIDMLLGTIEPAADTAVRATWAETFGGDFDVRWLKSLHDGFVTGTATQPLALRAQAGTPPALQRRPADSLDIVFRPDPCVWDGRFSNIAWLQELPKPLTKLTWDNVIAISPRLAERLGTSNGDRVNLTIGERQLEGPAWIVPGQATNTVTLSLGYGRTRAGRVGDALGYNAYELRSLDDPWTTVGKLVRAEGQETLATTQLHHRMDGFYFVREVTPEQPSLPPAKPQPSLYPEWPYPGAAWGMVIDLDTCIGCNACVAACNAENNIAVVGKDQVARGREMQWLRVDRYFTGELDNPKSFFQPVPCMHCEKAPCEMGCPVHATVHSPEGINQMVYNRCIGTRTCSSYCPYKVRRFNWYDYRAPADSPVHAADNPDVTVRSRGVMEKCTYCTQRIEAAHVAADKENRTLRTDEVVTACQQACPTSAIVFGDLNDPNSAVAKRRISGRHYALLEELGTRPRTTYLARWNDDPGKPRGNS